MDELLKLYFKLQDQIAFIEDYETLTLAEKQMSVIENKYEELIRNVITIMTYFPRNHEEEFGVYVWGADYHNVAHTIELLYPNAKVNWFINVAKCEWSIIEEADYIVISPRIAKEIINDNGLFNKLSHTIGYKAKCILSLSEYEVEIGLLYDKCNKNGLIVNSIDNHALAQISRPLQAVSEDNKNPQYKTVYVACPAGIKTGGTELLHQLVYWINYYGGKAILAVYGRKEGGCLSHPELAKYVAGHLCNYEEIEDMEENALILPEVCPAEGMKHRKMKQYYWWLSVDNYLNCFTNNEIANNYFEAIDLVTYKHLVQSEYSRNYLVSNSVTEDRISYLGDYINQIYLDNADMINSADKEDIVLYNPSKGLEFTSKLIELSPDLNWVAIKGLSTIEVFDLMKKSKIYIDFGNHPGKDRIPREAAICKCIIITGKRGSAANDYDVTIPRKYKFDEEDDICQDIIDTIKCGLREYDRMINEFEEYRNRIIDEKEEFLKEIIEYFFVKQCFKV